MRRLVAILALAAAATAGCGGGGDGDGEDRAREGARAYLAALADGQQQPACDALSARARRGVIEEVGAFVDSESLNCEEAVRELSADIAAEARRRLREPAIGDVQIDGDRASVEVEGVRGDVPLVREGDEWRVDRAILEFGG